jgi:hypothetical protein
MRCWCSTRRTRAPSLARRAFACACVCLCVRVLVLIHAVVHVRLAATTGARFAASLPGPRPTDVRTPRVTKPDPKDSLWADHADGGLNFVCLGCDTPRILLYNTKCGKCELRATTSTEDYKATFGRTFGAVKSHASREADVAARTPLLHRFEKTTRLSMSAGAARRQ